MVYRGLVCLLFGALAWGQAGTSAQAPEKQGAPAATASSTEGTPAEPNVPPDTVVITLNGVCPGSASAQKDSNCKTTLTRAEFEKVVNAVQPDGMPAFARKQFANRYAMGLVMANKAEQMGLDKGDRFDTLMKLARMQVLNQELGQTLQEKAGQVSDQELQDYYDKNQSNYEEASLQRLFVPKRKTYPTPKDSKEQLTAEQSAKRDAEGEAAMKTEAEALRKRAVAGEDIYKLQEEAFKFAGLTAKPPSSSMGKVRRTALPPGHAAVFDLKPNSVSEVLSDQTGYYVYKMGEKDALPLDKVKTEIHNTIRSQRMQQDMQSIQQAATPELNETYFAVPEGQQGPNPTQMMHEPPAKPEAKSDKK
jgi:hypothetical protein